MRSAAGPRASVVGGEEGHGPAVLGPEGGWGFGVLANQLSLGDLTEDRWEPSPWRGYGQETEGPHCSEDEEGLLPRSWGWGQVPIRRLSLENGGRVEELGICPESRRSLGGVYVRESKVTCAI